MLNYTFHNVSKYYMCIFMFYIVTSWNNMNRYPIYLPIYVNKKVFMVAHVLCLNLKKKKIYLMIIFTDLIHVTYVLWAFEKNTIIARIMITIYW